ncbi:hypothetical protein [Shewanella atlantica]|uniref:hypothetical protein n=1 Tax=Shewanella atlantica TaxID=271099 RepID=UPI00163ADF77|nr:hypothetical protein [Shewanella atlantica]
MGVEKLKAEHVKIGSTIKAANKAMPFQAMTLAKKAAEQSHDLLGEIINKIESLEASR